MREIMVRQRCRSVTRVVKCAGGDGWGVYLAHRPGSQSCRSLSGQQALENVQIRHMVHQSSQNEQHLPVLLNGRGCCTRERLRERERHPRSRIMVVGKKEGLGEGRETRRSFGVGVLGSEFQNSKKRSTRLLYDAYFRWRNWSQGVTITSQALP
jgi:hypothetical protein